MARNAAYRRAEQKIEEARRAGATHLNLSLELNKENFDILTELPDSLWELTALQSLALSQNGLITLPEAIGQLTALQSLDLSHNQLTTLPESISRLTALQSLDLSDNQFTALPEAIGQFTALQSLSLHHNQIMTLPEALGNITTLKALYLGVNEGESNNFLELPTCVTILQQLELLQIEGLNLALIPEWLSSLFLLKRIWANTNQINQLPVSLSQLQHLDTLELADNPLNPELAAAYEQGLDAVMAYLRARAEEQIILNEAKLILVGEGEVGKTCLMDALADVAWQEHESTHGIQIRPVTATDAASGRVITLNGWDFGGQRVYRPTHQLFFSSPAVYLVVWKPREGPQQGLVKEWIKLVTHREPDAKILVVATHGGPGGRQPDIDRQELWDLFGRETVLDFYHVESKPNEAGRRRGIDELKQRIARIAAELPEMGRSVPKSFQAARQVLLDTGEAYLPLGRVYAICKDQGMDDKLAQLFVIIAHRLGHLIHYEHDPILRDIVVLKPDWLATAISFVLDDEITRKQNGLVPFARLQQLWHDPAHDSQFRYPPELHPIFLRLMERFDLSYRVAGLALGKEDEPVSLIAQLVADTRPQTRLAEEWPEAIPAGDTQQMQICRIVDEQNGQSATAEGLFYQLIVRLHHLSLGRNHFDNSVH